MSVLHSPTSDGSSALGRPSAVTRRLTSRAFGADAALAIGVVLVAIVAGAGLVHSYLGLPGPNAQDLNHTLQAPSAAHLFGTDDLGRDVLSRTLAAATLDLRVAVMLTAISFAVGVTLGVISGFAGGVIDAVIMRLADIVLAFPFLVLAIAISAVFGPGLTGIYVAVPLVQWAIYARLTRAEVLSVRERTYIAAARSLGYSRRRILVRHALPNVWRPAIVYSASATVAGIMALASLSYLGLGVQPPTAEWGAIIQSGQTYPEAWWISVLPGLVIIIAGLGFSLIGDAIGDRLGTAPRQVS